MNFLQLLLLIANSISCLEQIPVANWRIKQTLPGTRLFLILLPFFFAVSCFPDSPSKEENQEHTSIELPQDTSIAVQFANDYVMYCNQINPELEVLEWIKLRQDVSQDFKTQLKYLLEKAALEDPELGLGFDPILNAQDHPSGFRFYKAEKGFVYLNGTNSEDFHLTIKMKKVKNRWLVDGAGLVNI